LSSAIAQGVVNTSMPRWDGVLNRQQIEEIASFLIERVKSKDRDVVSQQKAN